jgi:hypothetical protein
MESVEKIMGHDYCMVVDLVRVGESVNYLGNNVIDAQPFWKL